MAEKYGTIPPRFTKAWWEYFWTYYKGYVIAIALVLILAVVTVFQTINKPRYDITMLYAGSLMFPEDVTDTIIEKASPLCEDVDGNGEKSINFSQLNMNSDDLEYSSAMSQKLYLTLAAEDVYLYILDSDTVAPYLEDTPDESVFITLDEWYEKDLPEDAVFSHNGSKYGIKITECEIFKEIQEKYNADFSNTYLFMRYYPRDDQKEQVDGYNAAKKLAVRLIDNK